MLKTWTRIKNRQDARRILVVSPNLPEYDKHAGWLRLFQILEILTERYKITFIDVNWSSHNGQPLNYLRRVRRNIRRGLRMTRKASGAYAEALRDVGILAVDMRYADDLELLVKRCDFDLVMFEFYDTASRFVQMIRKVKPGLPIIVDSVDVHFNREFQMAKALERPDLFERAEQTKREELWVYKQADLILTVTERDKEILLKEDEGLRIDVLPTIHEVGEITPPECSSRQKGTMLFVGGFAHLANVDAVLYFCKDVIPLLKESLPYVKLKVVGSQPPKEILSLASPEVEILGYVPNLSPLLRASFLSVAPLRFGAGLKGKVGMAMAAGLPVVTTSVGAQGMDIMHGKDLMIADNPRDFAKAIVNLHTNQKLYETLAVNGRAFVQERFSRAVVRKNLLEVIKKFGTSKMG